MTEKRYTSNHLGVIFDNEIYGINTMTTNDIVDRLNALHEENERFKESLVSAIQNERTQLGRSVLLQFAESIGLSFTEGVGEES